MPNKTAQLQIRVTPEQKALIKAQAHRAGLGVSEFVLDKLCLGPALIVQRYIHAVARDQDRSFALAAIHDWLIGADNVVLRSVGDQVVVDELPVVWQNYLAALFEQAATAHGITPALWTFQVPELERAYFATTLRSLHPYLMQVSPEPFKRRNIFVDTGLGSRV